MIGTIIIAVVGYGLSLICVLGGCSALVDASRAGRRGNPTLRQQELRTFLAGSLFSVCIALMTRLLTGGQF